MIAIAIIMTRIILNRRKKQVFNTPQSSAIDESGNKSKPVELDSLKNINSAPIFVSYNRKESEFALKLSRDLIERGLNIWIDQTSILPGKRWDMEIENAMISASSVLVILSKTSASSENVLDEISYAFQHNKSIIPVLTETCNIPIRLTRLQHIDFRKDYPTAFNKLMEVLTSNDKGRG